MIQRKNPRTFFLRLKVKKRKNVLMYNFFLILTFYKNQTHGNGENPIRKIRNLVLVFQSKQG